MFIGQMNKTKSVTDWADCSFGEGYGFYKALPSNYERIFALDLTLPFLLQKFGYSK